MAKKKKFKDTYSYRVLIISIVFALIIGSGVAIIFTASGINEIFKWVTLGVLITLYIGTLIYSFIDYKKKKEEL